MNVVRLRGCFVALRLMLDVKGKQEEERKRNEKKNRVPLIIPG